MTIKCDLDYVPFTGHTDVVGIKHILNQVNAKNVILVHGEDEKMQRLAIDLREELRVDVQVPANFESVCYTFPDMRTLRLEDDGPTVEELLDTEACSFIASVNANTNFIRLL